MVGLWLGLWVVELIGFIGVYVICMWVVFGVEVVVVELLGGYALRYLLSWVFGYDGLEVLLWWVFFVQGKRFVVVVFGSVEYDCIVVLVDVVILDVDLICGVFWFVYDCQVVVVVSSFGFIGLYWVWQGFELVVWVLLGLVYIFGFFDWLLVVLVLFVQFVVYVMLLYVVNGVMLVLWAVRWIGRGQVIDLLMQECCLFVVFEIGVFLFFDDCFFCCCFGNCCVVIWLWGLYFCADGFVSFLVLQLVYWCVMVVWIVEVIGVDGVLDDAFVDMHVCWEVFDFIDDFIEQLIWFCIKLELFVEGQC